MMILFSIPEFFTKIGTEINALINKYSSNPIFWVLVLIALLAITYSAITALSNK